MEDRARLLDIEFVTDESTAQDTKNIEEAIGRFKPDSKRLPAPPEHIGFDSADEGEQEVFSEVELERHVLVIFTINNTFYSEDEEFQAANVPEGSLLPLDRRPFVCDCLTQCHEQFEDAKIMAIAASFRSITQKQRHIFLSHVLFCGATYPDDTAFHSPSRSGKRKRRNARKDYMTFRYIIQDFTVCRKMFCAIFECSNSLLSTISRWLKAHPHEIPTQADERMGHRPPGKYQYVVEYLNNYASLWGYPSPIGRGRKGDAPRMILWHEDTKSALYEKFVASATQNAFPIVTQKYFYLIWNKHCNHIRVATPGSGFCDYCNECFRESTPDVMRDMRAHIAKAMLERQYYNQAIKHSREQSCITSGAIKFEYMPSLLPILCSRPCTLHISIDFAQDALIPHEKREPAAIYFRTPYRLRMFGVSCETYRTRVIYIVPEGREVDRLKGCNGVINMVDDWLSHYSGGVQHLIIHADNCAGQNKNQFVMCYFAHLVARKQFKSIECAFMLVGHTKFDCDASFGLVKRKLKHTNVYTIDDFVKCVGDSSESISARLMPDNGWKDYRSFFEQYSAGISGIESYHVFQFDQRWPGRVRVMSSAYSQYYDTVRVFKPGIIASQIDGPGRSAAKKLDQFPLKIVGLHPDRVEQLKREIHPFVRKEDLAKWDENEAALERVYRENHPGKLSKWSVEASRNKKKAAKAQEQGESSGVGDRVAADAIAMQMLEPVLGRPLKRPRKAVGRRKTRF